jgi:hypothetical protein
MLSWNGSPNLHSRNPSSNGARLARAPAAASSRCGNLKGGGRGRPVCSSRVREAGASASVAIALVCKRRNRGAPKRLHRIRQVRHPSTPLARAGARAGFARPSFLRAGDET